MLEPARKIKRIRSHPLYSCTFLSKTPTKRRKRIKASCYIALSSLEKRNVNTALFSGGTRVCTSRGYLELARSIPARKKP